MQGYAAIAAKQGDSDGVRKYESYLAVSAFLAENNEDAIAALERIDNEMDVGVFMLMKVDGDGLLGRLIAISSPAAKQCEALREALTQGGNSPDALTEKVRELEELRVQVPTGGKQYVDSLITRGFTASKYESGRWTKVKFEKGLTGWRRRGNWTAEPATNSILYSGGARARLLWDYPIKPPYAVEVNVEIVKADGSYAGEKAGILAGEYSTGAANGALMFIDGAHATAGYDSSQNGCFLNDSESTKVRRLRTHVWKKFHTTTVNGRFSTIIQDDSFDPTGFTGLGNMAANSKSKTHTVRYSAFRIRKIDIAPPTKNLTDSIEYWSQWLESEPDNAYALQRRGIRRGMKSADNLDAAIEDLIASGKLNPKSVQTFTYLGAFYSEKAQFAKAKAAYLKSIQNTPEKLAKQYPSLIKKLLEIEASSSDETLRDGESALKRGMLLKKEFPDEVHIDTLIASAWATIGDFDKAVQWQEKALKKEPASPVLEARQERLALYKAGKPFLFSSEPRKAVNRKAAEPKPAK